MLTAPSLFLEEVTSFCFLKGEMTVFLHLDVPTHVSDMYSTSPLFAYCSMYVVFTGFGKIFGKNSSSVKLFETSIYDCCLYAAG